MLYNIAENPVISRNGLVTTVGYKMCGKTAYAFEGSVFNAGSAVQWLRDELGFFGEAADSEKLALSVSDNGGVYIVPAFTGLGAPYWNSDVRGIICGLTRGSGKAHITRAVLEAMAYSTKDLATVMSAESGVDFTEIRSDGGASANGFLMQFQANVLGVPVNRPEEKESTALGAVYLCGVGMGVIKEEDISDYRKTEKMFLPETGVDYDKYYKEWKRAVDKCVRN